ncbi:DUF4173 domain-containing protein [Allokutzneria sp. A3M-2-11 16]|uniref:DUF4153 domain-containing protein n=1 Tax=Allokutzneria sp. A3M-2-11 16 TaxID=2962043 RepID=UPI0020B6C54A|nr:DUF4173 domain-containing protein [Allokutzneria sp. A3M-2-11 16]MCP3805252.1 DUF4173 domain-containing protein [Allokutzneria sp. A3M-2-11 16]
MDRAMPPVLAAVAASGLVAALALSPVRPGLGWMITALAMAAAVVVAARSTETSVRKRNPGWAVLALALVAVGVFRDSRWLFTLCALTAIVAASLAVAGTSLRGAIEAPINALTRLHWLRRGVREIRPRGNTRTLLAVAVSGVLLIVFGGLLVSADPAFEALVRSLVPTVDSSSTFTSVTMFVVAALFATGLCWALTQPQPEFSLELPQISLRRIEWVLPISVLVLLFAAFVSVQLPALFSVVGDLSYAEYARRGFWQLLVVTALTLGVIGLASRLAPRETSGDRTWLRVLLGALSVLSLVIVAGAAVRMWIYQEEYGFTVLRILVLACELWLGLVYLLVIAAGVRLRGPWLPGAVVATGMVALLGLAVLNPERLIADGNISRLESTGKIDYIYLTKLSVDAVPALQRLPEPQRACVLYWPTIELEEAPDSWREWNLARSQARSQLVKRHAPCANVSLRN